MFNPPDTPFSHIFTNDELIETWVRSIFPELSDPEKKV
jgi:hypothetical protein